MSAADTHASERAYIPVDPAFLTECARDFIDTPSPVGYPVLTAELLERKAAEYGHTVEWDRKGTGYIKLEGRDRTKTVMVGAHLDTLGLVVRGFNDDGTLRIRKLGGVNYHFLEGQRCQVICRDGSQVEGVIICNHHSVHVFEDARTMKRDENNMSIALMHDVKCPDDARALGVTEGAVVAVDPDFTAYDNGYILSSYLDDKGCVACAFGILEYLKATGEKPAYDTWLSFPIYEEIGHGGAYVPEEVDEFVALDITLIGPDYDSDEHQVGIIAADGRGPYDWDLTNRLAEIARGIGSNWNMQVCYLYSTDAMAAYTKGANVAAAAFGPSTYSTHGKERCHVDALVETTRLAIAYVMGL